jgi:4-hydroxyacetophenone monooxygenase
VIHAGGLFSTPKLPDIAGVEDFEGRILHTTAWDHEYELAGKRVALIGTGSTGAQLMPHLARETAHLTVFQRTPNWILPVSGYHAPVPLEQQWLLQNLPYYWNWFCYATVVLDKQIEELQERDPAWIAEGGRVSARNDALRTFLEDSMEQALADRPDLLQKCRPAYPPAARRLVADNGWFQALKRPNVDLVTDPIARITKDAVVTAQGVQHQVDLIVMASGFQTSRYLWPVRYQGRGEATPEIQWAKDGARAYLGVTMTNFPNLFIFYGPNGQPRSGSFPSWAEVWARYALGLIVETLEVGETALEVRASVFDTYNQELDQSVRHLIWDSPGANSYYLNEHGRSGLNMPWRTEDYFARLMRPDIENYRLG